MSRGKISTARVKVVAHSRAAQVIAHSRAIPIEPSTENLGACYREGDSKAPEDKQRVAAYCRVSTLAGEQELSFETQCDHYRERIEHDPQMVLIGVYGDHGITGLSAKKRPAFQRLMQDCMDGKLEIKCAYLIQGCNGCIHDRNPGKKIPLLEVNSWAVFIAFTPWGASQTVSCNKNKRRIFQSSS